MQEDEKLLKALAELIKASGEGEREVVPEQLERVELVRDAMRCSVDKRSKIECEIDELFPGVADITIIGKPIGIVNPDMFAKAIRIADNFEVYPKTNGSVQMNLAFYNVTRRVKK